MTGPGMHRESALPPPRPELETVEQTGNWSAIELNLQEPQEPEAWNRVKAWAETTLAGGESARLHFILDGQNQEKRLDRYDNGAVTNPTVQVVLVGYFWVPPGRRFTISPFTDGVEDRAERHELPFTR